MRKKITIGIIIGVLIIAGFFSYFYLKPELQPEFVYGDEILEVLILSPDSSPISNLEVDLWTAENPEGPPTAGYSTTNEKGIAVFKILKGEYSIGFNGYNFPEEFLNPGRITVKVLEGKNIKTISLEPHP